MSIQIIEPQSIHEFNYAIAQMNKPSDIVKDAVDSDQLDAIIYLIETGVFDRYHDFMYMIKMNKYNNIVYLIENSYIHPEGTFLDNAAHYGHISIVKFLHLYTDYTWFTLEHAAKMGHRDLAKYLHFDNAPVSNTALMFTIIAGHIPIVRFLYTADAPIYDRDLDRPFADGTIRDRLADMLNA